MTKLLKLVVTPSVTRWPAQRQPGHCIGRAKLELINYLVSESKGYLLR